jgi:hypothetical protein
MRTLVAGCSAVPPQTFMGSVPELTGRVRSLRWQAGGPPAELLGPSGAQRHERRRFRATTVVCGWCGDAIPGGRFGPWSPGQVLQRQVPGGGAPRTTARAGGCGWSVSCRPMDRARGQVSDAHATWVAASRPVVAAGAQTPPGGGEVQGFAWLPAGCAGDGEGPGRRSAWPVSVTACGVGTTGVGRAVRSQPRPCLPGCRDRVVRV